MQLNRVYIFSRPEHVDQPGLLHRHNDNCKRGANLNFLLNLAPFLFWRKFSWFAFYHV